MDDQQYSVPGLGGSASPWSALYGQQQGQQKQPYQQGTDNPLLALLLGYGTGGRRGMTPIAGVNASRGVSPAQMTLGQGGMHRAAGGPFLTPDMRTTSLSSGTAEGGY